MATEFVLAVIICILCSNQLCTSQLVRWSAMHFRVLDRALRSWRTTSRDCMARMLRNRHPVAFERALFSVEDAELQALSQGRHKA